VLYIEPLAPLSLVTSMPGAYYRSAREPSSFMIYGMLENLLGWHFDKKEKGQVIKRMKAYHKKQYGDSHLAFDKSLVGYIPIIQNHISINKPMLKPDVESFDDYWTQHLKHSDQRHAKGSRNYDFRLSRCIDNIRANSSNDQDKELAKLMKDNAGLFPMYYQSPTRREFISVKGKYGFQIVSTKGLFEQLIEALKQLEVPLYLGTNEGWIDLNIQPL
jgi:CRISPR-associated protein Cas5